MIFHGRSSLTGAGFPPRCPRGRVLGSPRVGGPWTSLQDQAGKAALPHPVDALFLGFPLSHPPFRDKTEDNLASILSSGSPGA